jgi:hypothetical protein
VDTDSSDKSDEVAAPQSPTATNSEPLVPVAPGDELPVTEDLTPEIMEDECRRGDAMLRWATLLLSVLFSWTYITDPAVLVQIRSGEYMLSHGWLPPRVDPFSAAAQGSPWINLGWLSDLDLGLTHQLAGLPGATLSSALCAAVAWWALNRITIPGVTTWWASICLVAAVLGAFPVLQPGSGVITVLGLSLLLWRLNSAHYQSTQGLLWQIPLLMCLWSNADPRAWLGLLWLLGWAIGSTLQKPVADQSTSPAPPTAGLAWKVLGASVVASVIHPWHIHVLLAPYQKLAVLIPETQRYAERSDMGLNWLIYGVLQPEFWDQADVFAGVAIGLLVLSAFCFTLNWRNVQLGHLLGWLLINGLAIFSGELLACASIVNAVTAALNGQDWFRRRFSQEYRVDGWSVVLAQAGRSLTVISFFVLAYLMINGALTGPAGRRVGWGLDPRWRDRIAGLERVAGALYQNRAFPLRLDQGDLLIWIGKQPYVDSRLGLYTQTGENLLTKHRTIRTALRSEREQIPGSGRNDIWKEGLSAHQTYAVLPRLWGQPDYNTFYDLVQQGWTLLKLSGSAAVFLPTTVTDPALTAFLEEQGGVDFVREGLREVDPDTFVDLRPMWPTPATVYDRWLIQPLPRSNDGMQMAAHYGNLRQESFNFLKLVLQRAADPNEPNVEQLARLGTDLMPRTLALTFLTIRHARRGLEEQARDGGHSAQRAVAYRQLRGAYLDLAELEQLLGLRFGNVQLPTQIRSNQALAAAYMTLSASGSDEDLLRLAQMQIQMQALDLGHQTLLAYRQRTGRLSLLPITEMAGLDEQTQAEELLEELEVHLENVRKRLGEVTGEEATPQRLLGIALEGSCPGMALNILDRNRVLMANNPDLMLMHANLLLINGRLEEAWESLEGLERRFPPQRIPQSDQLIFQNWSLQTAIANAVVHDLGRAQELLKRSAYSQTRSALRGLLEQPPGALALPEQLDLNPAIQLTMFGDLFIRRTAERDQTLFDIARLQWEQGDIPATTKTLQTLLEANPETKLRPLVAWMLTLLTQEPWDPEPPSEQIPVTPDLFAPETDSPEPQ